jgi:hypothetical protein
MSGLTEAERKLRSQIGVHAALARRTVDRLAAVASKAEILAYEAKADPEEKFLPEERRRRAWHLYMADQARLQLEASKAGRRAPERGCADAPFD